MHIQSFLNAEETKQQLLLLKVAMIQHSTKPLHLEVSVLDAITEDVSEEIAIVEKLIASATMTVTRH